MNRTFLLGTATAARSDPACAAIGGSLSPVAAKQ